MGQHAILTCRRWILYTTRYLDFVLEHLECFLWRACTLMHTNLCLGATCAKLSLQHATKIKSLPKHPTHDAVFDIKYMKLFGARPNVFHSFGLHIKQFLTASNIDFSGIHILFDHLGVLLPNIVLGLVHQKKDHKYASISKQLFMEIQNRYHNYIAIYTDRSQEGNSMACAEV